MIGIIEERVIRKLEEGVMGKLEEGVVNVTKSPSVAPAPVPPATPLGNLNSTAPSKHKSYIPVC